MEGVSNVPRVLVTPEVVKMGGDKLYLYHIQIALPDRRSGSVSAQHEFVSSLALATILSGC
jgi:hypothetical protein